ncbi:hypothetical protein EZS27_022357, partial [termite gut metagenome]
DNKFFNKFLSVIQISALGFENVVLMFQSFGKNFQTIQKEKHPSTIKKDLQYLRDEQVLVMIGKGKGSVYVFRQT